VTPEEWKRARALFDAAVEKPTAERAAFVAESCGQDEALRGTVESLLHADVHARDVLESPALGDTFVEERPEALLGSRLGDYEVVGIVGQGGMGVVYHGVRADDAFRKRVAIKLIKRGMDSAFILQRFRHEREILASFDHPNIARLMDAGTAPDGRPYFVMEFVDGKPIDRFCEEQRLDVRGRIHLFRRVCAAVASAHQNLVVHRDLKPGNILITADGTPKLLDFGLAKLLDPGAAGESTATGLFLMTPEYASPEQVRGERITTATDVYSLGVLLYELLAGRKPYALASRHPQELLRVVCLVEPERPSAVAPRELRRSLAGDLDNVALMALRKEPERRYASVEQLSDDLGRHLERRPVHARPDTFWYRTGRLLGRNRLASALVVALVAWVGIATYQARLARQQRARAEHRFEDVRRLANSLMFEVHDAIRDLGGSTKARELVVQRALEYLGSLAQESDHDPGLRLELGQAYKRIGEIQYSVGTSSLGDSRAALDSYAKGAALLRPLADAGDGKAATALAALHFVEGGVFRGRGELDDALMSYAAAERLDRELIRRDAGGQASVRALVDVQREMARTLVERGQLATGILRHREAVRMAESLAASPRAADSDRVLLARAYRDLGDALRMAGDLEGALVALGQSEPLVRQRLKDEPGSVDALQNVAKMNIRTGDILMHKGDWAAARERFQEAVEIQRGLARADPANGVARDEVASGSTRLCEALLLLSRAAEAGPACRDGYEIGLESWRANPTDEYAWAAAIGHSWMARWCGAVRDASGARKHHLDAVRIFGGLAERKPTAEFKAGLAEEHRGFAGFLESQGALAEASDHYRAALTLFQGVADADPEDYESRLALAQSLGGAARAREGLGGHPDACVLAFRASQEFGRVDAKHPLPSHAVRDRALLAPLLKACTPAGGVSPSSGIRRGL
jgi:tetratricopeptide (TPR) repeat protein/tRNA A-37 threonylcarbamoyl transferase component Bud32